MATALASAAARVLFAKATKTGVAPGTGFKGNPQLLAAGLEAAGLDALKEIAADAALGRVFRDLLGLALFARRALAQGAGFRLLAKLQYALGDLAADATPKP